MIKNFSASIKNRALSLLTSSSNAIFLFLGLLLLAMWAHIAYDLKNTHEKTLNQAGQELHNLTNIYAEDTASSIDILDYALIDLRDEWRNNPQQFLRRVHTRLPYLDPSIFYVAIISPKGELIFSSNNWGAQPHINVSDREHFQFHLHNLEDELHIGKPLLLRSLHRLAVIASRPLHGEDNEFDGVISLAVSPEYFSRFNEYIDLGEGGAITLARTNGDLIARHPRPGQVVDTTIQSAPWLNARANEHGFFQKHSEVDKVERLFAWRVLEDGKLAVILGKSTKAILAPYYDERRTYLWWGGVASMFILLSVYVIGRDRLQRAKANASMRQMEQALQRSQKLESLGKLTGGVAHDFNNILQIISSNVQLLRMTPTRENQVEPHLKSISEAVARGSKVALQLLTFARRQPLHPSVLNPEKLIRNMDDLIARLVGEDVDVQICVADGLWNVLVDTALLENVILNLAANARDAMGAKGLLRISLSNESVDEHRAACVPGISPGAYVAIAISDNGSGMPPEVAEQAFEPFYTTKPEGKGTGLGLSMAYGFAKESGGHIHIDSKVGSGTTVRIFLPRSSEEPPALASPSVIPLAGGTGTILVVEDNAQLRDMAALMLERLGYRVLKAANAAQALGIFEKGEAIDALLADVLMPGGMNGIELARRVKAMHPDLTILLASGAYEVHESINDICMAFDDVHFLQKPYSIEEVDHIVRAKPPQTVG